MAPIRDKRAILFNPSSGVSMILKPIPALLLGLVFSGVAQAAAPVTSNKLWTAPASVAGFTSEIVAFDSINRNLWVAGVNGVDVLNAATGSLLQHIDTTAFGSINSVSIHNGLAAFAIESAVRTDPGVVKFYDTTTRTLASGINSVAVGALPDMLTFTADGSRLLVANEASIGGGIDPAGSVSIIDMSTRSVSATAGFGGVPTSGSNIRTFSDMDFEPEYIAVNAAGTQAFVTLQEANAIGILDLQTQQFTSVVGLGTKDFNTAANGIDVNRSNGAGPLTPVDVRGLYQPDSIAAYSTGGQTFYVIANEGDAREDGTDEIDAQDVPGASVPAGGGKLTLSAPDSSASGLVAFGGRSFSILDDQGGFVFDSGNTLESEAILRGIYDDGRSDNKGVEPEGVELMEIGGRTYAFIGLERTLKAAVAIYDITDPANASFVDMIVTDGDRAPEGMKGFTIDGVNYLAIANEVSKTTSLYQLTAAVPEPETYAMLLAGLGLVGFMAKRRQA
jgi:DNA-binding beta-propeller fold protein YncE